MLNKKLSTNTSFSLFVSLVGSSITSFIYVYYSKYIDNTQLLLVLLIQISSLIIIYQTIKGWLKYNSQIHKKSEISISNEYNYIVLIGLIISIFNFGHFFLNETTAYQWSGIDSGPHLERLANPYFLQNDFFTNSSSISNPRHLFTYSIHYLSVLFETHWYTIFFSIKLIILLVPSLFFFSIIFALKKRIIEPNIIITLSIIIGSIIIYSLYDSRIFALFSIAAWPSYTSIVTPSALALFFALTSIVFFLNTNYNNSYLVLLFATLLHPSIGFFSLILLILFDFNASNSKRYLSAFFISIVPAYLVLIAFFKGDSVLNVQQFIEHYVIEPHSFHYYMPDFLSYLNFPWHYSFLFIVSIFIANSVFGFFKKDIYLSYLSLSCLIVYFGWVFSQYFFINILPIKGIIAFGPSRFSMFGFWLVLLVLAYVLAKYAPRDVFPKNYPKLFSTKKAAVISLCALNILFFIGLSNIDNYESRVTSKYPEIYQWIEKNTSPDDVFAAPPEFMPIDLILVAERAVFYSNTFPFTENVFEENTRRKNLIYGSYVEQKSLVSEILNGSSAYYRTLTPQDFYLISKEYQLDYILIETDFSENFKGFRPEISDNGWNVYQIKKLYDYE